MPPMEVQKCGMSPWRLLSEFNQALPEKLEESDPFSLFGTVSRNLQLEGSNVQWGFADICDLVRGNFELGLAFFSLIISRKNSEAIVCTI